MVAESIQKQVDESKTKINDKKKKSLKNIINATVTPKPSGKPKKPTQATSDKSKAS